MNKDLSRDGFKKFKLNQNMPLEGFTKSDMKEIGHQRAKKSQINENCY